MAEKMRGKRMALIAAASTIGLLGFASTPADAALTIDMRIMGGADAKTMNNVKTGDTITLSVVAQISGADATANEGIQSILGSFVSTPSGGSGVGNFGTGQTGSWAPSATFNNGGSFQAGKLQDLNGLPGLDLGSIAASSDAAATDYVQARSPSLTVAPNAGTAGAPAELTLGTVQFLVTGGQGGNISLNWFPLVSGGGLTVPAGGGYDANAAIWRQDGANVRPTTAVLSSGAPVVLNMIPIPEPASAGLLGLGAMGLLIRRRRRA